MLRDHAHARRYRVERLRCQDPLETLKSTIREAPPLVKRTMAHEESCIRWHLGHQELSHRWSINILVYYTRGVTTFRQNDDFSCGLSFFFIQTIRLRLLFYLPASFSTSKATVSLMLLQDSPCLSTTILPLSSVYILATSDSGNFLP